MKRAEQHETRLITAVLIVMALAVSIYHAPKACEPSDPGCRPATATYAVLPLHGPSSAGSALPAAMAAR